MHKGKTAIIMSGEKEEGIEVLHIRPDIHAFEMNFIRSDAGSSISRALRDHPYLIE